MPAQQGGGRDHEQRPAPARQQTTQGGEQRAVLGLEARSRVLAAQDLELVTQDEDLDLLGIAGAQQEKEQLHHATKRQVDEGPDHDALPAGR